MRALLEQLMDRRDLAESQAAELLQGLISADVPDVMKGAVLAALRTKGETGTELRGLAMAMRALAVAVVLPDGMPALDTCGTGGDGSGSFNVSTAAALLVASMGVPVVKHGNRSVSSRCGSADVVESLGVALRADAAHARAQLTDHGFAFLFAPNFHPATAAVGAVRRSLGVRTTFNLLGPLTNPAAPPYQLVGAASADIARKLADALSGMPITRAFVVHGAPAWDEATPFGPFLVIDVRPGVVSEALIDPFVACGVPRAHEDALAGGDAAHNATMMHHVFRGAPGPVRDAVLLNAGLALELVGRVASLREGFHAAADAIDSGLATRFLAQVGPRE